VVAVEAAVLAARGVRALDAGRPLVVLVTLLSSMTGQLSSPATHAC